jgi:hypothetical protein
MDHSQRESSKRSASHCGLLISQFADDDFAPAGCGSGE